MTPFWYWRRLRRMSATEIVARARARVRQYRWRRPERRPDGLRSLVAGDGRTAQATLRAAPASGADPVAADLFTEADRLLAGELTLFGRTVRGFGPHPDWFADPLTGRRSDPLAYCFDVAYRNEAATGNVKFVWEPSRHLQVMQLASAWRLSGREAYAARAAQLLTSWWHDNPFLQGVHWVSAIEAGLRLLSWTWIRALLQDWPGCRALFDDNPTFLAQLYHHQIHVAAFRSHGSSANNHLLAELAGLATAAVAFPWFAESASWAATARAGLIEEACRQTFGDGFNREQAMDYHLFVLEILLSAGLAARLAGRPLGSRFDDVLIRMADALAASLDAAGRPPRFGDGDDGRALALDGPARSATEGVLGAAAALFGRAPWWPAQAEADSVLRRVAAVAATGRPAVRNVVRADLMRDSGHAFLRSGAGGDEIWLRCDHGRLGYLSIAAHGHADALSLELRVGGVEILADPGTYCYHGEPAWRRCFKGTLGHNTLTVDGRDQAESGGPFLWLTDAPARLDSWSGGQPGTRQVWSASHTGYRRLSDPVTHHRLVALEPDVLSVEIADWIEAAAVHQATLAFHFGHAVDVTLDGSTATLAWRVADRPWRGELRLPAVLRWSLHRGETDPPRGWYSAGFARKQPSFLLLGHGILGPEQRLITALDLRPRAARQIETAQQTESARCAALAAF